MKINPAVLKPHPLLALLPYSTVKRLLADSAVDEYPKGAVLFREGERCDAIYVIISGRCELADRARARVPSVVEEVCGPGDTLGDRAFLNDEPHRTHRGRGHARGAAAHPGAGARGHLYQGRAPRRPLLANRHAQAAPASPRAPAGPATRVRRVVSLLALAPRMDAAAVNDRLAASLRATHRSSMSCCVRLSPEGEATALARVGPARPAADGAFPFARQVRPHEDGYDELRLPIGPRRANARLIAPLIGDCGRHYDYVLVHVDPAAARRDACSSASSRPISPT